MSLRRHVRPDNDGTSLITSRLLPELFAGYDEGDSLTILDLGPGNAGTIEFLSRFRAKVVFADLLEHPAIGTALEDTAITTISGFISRQLAIPDGTSIDICLLWDYLHYIDMPTIQALSQVLRPMFHKNTRGYGFGALHGKKPDDANQYGIAAIDQLVARPTSAEPAYMAHSQQRIGEHFAALRICRGTLLREGRLELLFEAP